MSDRKIPKFPHRVFENPSFSVFQWFRGLINEVRIAILFSSDVANAATRTLPIGSLLSESSIFNDWTSWTRFISQCFSFAFRQQSPCFLYKVNHTGQDCQFFLQTWAGWFTIFTLTILIIFSTLKFSQKSKFRTSKMTTFADFDILKLPNLILGKIWLSQSEILGIFNTFKCGISWKILKFRTCKMTKMEAFYLLK